MEMGPVCQVIRRELRQSAQELGRIWGLRFVITVPLASNSSSDGLPFPQAHSGAGDLESPPPQSSLRGGARVGARLGGGK